MEHVATLWHFLTCTVQGAVKRVWAQRSLTWSSSGPDWEDLLDVDQELLLNKLTERMCGMRSFMVWNDIPEFDSASSSQDDNTFTGSRT